MIEKTEEKTLMHLPESVRVHIEHLERVRRDFVANVSHELRTPLTVIRGYLELLLNQNHSDTKPWKKIFTQMYQYGIQMENMIEDLLLLSLLESEEQEVKTQKKIRVAQMLKKICEDAKNMSGALGHNISLQAKSNLTVDGVANELKSLFSNIIMNAVKYTPAKGHITVEWYSDRGGAVFKVVDTGIGIGKKHIPRITERFYRVDKARSRERGGTGLGLAIAKHVLLRHQGELKIESQVSKGSTFICVFPKSRTSIIKMT